MYSKISYDAEIVNKIKKLKKVNNEIMQRKTWIRQTIFWNKNKKSRVRMEKERKINLGKNKKLNLLIITKRVSPLKIKILGLIKTKKLISS